MRNNKLKDVKLDKKLLKSYESEKRLQEKMAELQKKMEEEKAKTIEFEKTHLHKDYLLFDISLEEYSKITRGAVYNYLGLADKDKNKASDKAVDVKKPFEVKNNGISNKNDVKVKESEVKNEKKTI